MQLEMLPTKKLSQKERILRLLQAKGSVSNVELNRQVGFRYSARLWELRREGYVIDTGPTDKYGRCFYHYRESADSNKGIK